MAQPNNAATNPKNEQQKKNDQKQIQAKMEALKQKLTSLLDQSSVPLIHVGKQANISYFTAFNYYSYLAILYLQLCKNFSKKQGFPDFEYPIEFFSIVFRVLRILLFNKKKKINELQEYLVQIDKILAIDTSKIRQKWVTFWDKQQLQPEEPQSKLKTALVWNDKKKQVPIVGTFTQLLLKISDILELFSVNLSKITVRFGIVALLPLLTRLNYIIVMLYNKFIAGQVRVLLQQTPQNQGSSKLTLAVTNNRKVYLYYCYLLHQILTNAMYKAVLPSQYKQSYFTIKYREINLTSYFKLFYNQMWNTYTKAKQLSPDPFSLIDIKHIKIPKDQIPFIGSNENLINDINNQVLMSKLDVFKKQIATNFKTSLQYIKNYEIQFEKHSQERLQQEIESNSLYIKTFQTTVQIIKILQLVSPKDFKYGEDSILSFTSTKQEIINSLNMVLKAKLYSTQQLSKQQMNCLIFMATDGDTTPLHMIQYTLYTNLSGSFKKPVKKSASIDQCYPQTQKRWFELLPNYTVLKQQSYSRLGKQNQYAGIDEQEFYQFFKQYRQDILKSYYQSNTTQFQRSFIHSAIQTILAKRNIRSISNEEKARLQQSLNKLYQKIIATNLIKGVQDKFSNDDDLRVFWAKYLSTNKNTDKNNQQINSQRIQLLRKEIMKARKSGTPVKFQGNFQKTWNILRNQAFGALQRKNQILLQNKELLRNSNAMRDVNEKVSLQNDRIKAQNQVLQNKIQIVDQKLVQAAKLKNQAESDRKKSFFQIAQRIKLLKSLAESVDTQHKMSDQIQPMLRSLIYMQKQPLQAFKKLFGFISKTASDESLIKKYSQFIQNVDQASFSSFKKKQQLATAFSSKILSIFQKTGILKKVGLMGQRYRMNKNLIQMYQNQGKQTGGQSLRLIDENIMIQKWLSQIQEIYNQFITGTLDQTKLKKNSLLNYDIYDLLLDALMKGDFQANRLSLQQRLPQFEAQLKKATKEWQEDETKLLKKNQAILDDILREINNQMNKTGFNWFDFLKKRLQEKYLMSVKIKQKTQKTQQLTKYAKCLTKRVISSFVQLWKFSEIFSYIIDITLVHYQKIGQKKKVAVYKKIERAYNQNVIRQGLSIIQCQTSHMENSIREIHDLIMSEIKTSAGNGYVQEPFQFFRMVKGFSEQQVVRRLKQKDWRNIRISDIQRSFEKK